MSNNTTNINGALVLALGELKNVAKNAINPHFRNRYTSLDAILDSARPVLAKHGLAISQEPIFEEGRAGVITRILHSGGEEKSSTLLLPLKDQSAQGVGSALTYARRYSISSILGIASDDDDDGHVASTPAKVVKPVTPPKVASGSPPPKVDWAKKVSDLMNRDKVSDKDIFRFLEAKGAKVSAEYIPDLPVNLLQRVTEVWPDVVEFAFTHMEVAA